LAYFEPNTKVIIESGPLAGAEGVVVSANKRQNLIVSITLLRRSIATEIDPSWVRKVVPPKSRTVAPPD
jgi:transcription antitermination factor NusG